MSPTGGLAQGCSTRVSSHGGGMLVWERGSEGAGQGCAQGSWGCLGPASRGTRVPGKALWANPDPLGLGEGSAFHGLPLGPLPPQPGTRQGGKVVRGSGAGEGKQTLGSKWTIKLFLPGHDSQSTSGAL